MVLTLRDMVWGKAGLFQYSYTMEKQGKKNEVKETITRCIEALRLKVVSISHFIEFKRLSEQKWEATRKETKALKRKDSGTIL